MPNRILRDYTDSYRFDGLSSEAECLFIRLIMKADDFGNFHGDDRIVSALCFPLGSNMPTAERLSELEDRGIIKFYVNKGRKYLTIINFGQRLRSHTRKFPDPMTADGGHVADNSPSSDSNPRPEEKRREVEVEENRNELLVFSGEVSPDPEEPSDPYSPEFETLWSAFPEKKGKGGAWRVWKSKVRGRISVEELVRIIHLQQLDRAEAKRRGEFYPAWQHPQTWLNDDGWHNELKYPQKKEKAGDSVPARWREILVDRYPGNFPEGIAGANFPNSFSLLPASVQSEIREHADLVSEISEAIHATTTKEAA
jgi:hypothetical protein